MNQEDDFRSLSIAIVGLGLMGGSLALALKSRCKRLLGVDREAAAVEVAKANGIVDQASTDISEIIPAADVIVLAVPVATIIHLLQRIPDIHPGCAVILDLGSTKVRILEAMRNLPERFDPIGGHPMCGKENAGLEFAEAGLFKNAPFALVPLERSSDRAREIALRLVEIVGARELWLGAEDHDAWTAATSHFPYLAANALAAVTPVQAAPMIGPGFRSTTRLAPSSLQMMMEILETNQNNILEVLAVFKQRIQQIEDALEDEDWKTLAFMLAEGADRRNLLVGGQT